MSGGATINNSGVVSLTASGFDGVTGLGAATIPQFIYRSGTGTYLGSFVGTSLHQYDSYNGQVEAANGITGGSLDTTAGPFVKISRSGGPVNTACVGNNNVDSECDAALAVYAQQPASATVQTTAIYGAAMSSGTTEPGADAIGVTGSGRSVNANTGIGTGAYLEGRRDNATGSALGAEIRTENDGTSIACGYNITGIGPCDGIWVTSTGQGTDNDLSTAVHVAAVTNGIYRWHAGFTINQGGVTTYGVDDESSATNSYYTNGTHTYAFVSGANAGNVGIGTLTPGSPLVVTTAASGVVESLTNSAGTCTHTPGASTETVACSSDARLKEDIHDANSALVFFDGIHVREFEVKATGEHKTGVIAQEMLQDYGQMVHMGADGFYTVDEPNPWQLVKAIQELRAEITKLKKLQ